MAQRDAIHDVVKNAVMKIGWQITHDPYIITFGERFLFVDLGAIQYSPLFFIGAEQAGRKIVIEIKTFGSKSAIADLEQAIGQYMLYKLLLKRIEPDREVYLAISDKAYQDIFSEPIGQLVITDLPLNLLVVNLAKMEVEQWIP